jgi:hypothetical protein
MMLRGKSVAIKVGQIGEETFGIRVDGVDPGISFSTVTAALVDADKLRARGYRSVVIFDRSSGCVVKHVIPEPDQV